MKYKLIREKDNLTLEGNVIMWLEWNEDDTFKAEHEGPAVGCSLILDPGRYGYYKWLTTEVLEFEQVEGTITFKTKNSVYKLIDNEYESNTI